MTARGAAQAAATAAAVRLGAEDRLLSSTLRRAVDTATSMGRSPERVADVDEFRFGPAWTWEQAHAGEHRALWRPQDRAGDESLGEFQTRVQSVVIGMLADPPPGRLIMVVHSGVIDAVMRWAFGAGPDSPWTTEVIAPHASLTEIHHWPHGRHHRGAPRHTFVVRLGDVAHLPTDLVTGI